MKYIGYLISISIILTSCSKNEVKYLPGEKYTIDTIMYREYRKLDSAAQLECAKITDEVFRKAYDSLFRLRVKDISSIKGNGIPPVVNNFPKAVKELKIVEKKKK